MKLVFTEDCVRVEGMRAGILLDFSLSGRGYGPSLRELTYAVFLIEDETDSQDAPLPPTLSESRPLVHTITVSPTVSSYSYIPITAGMWTAEELSGTT